MERFFEVLEQRQLLSVSISPISTLLKSGSTYYTNSPSGKTVLVPVHSTTTASGVTYKLSSSTSNVKASLVPGLQFLQMNISIDGVAQTPLVFALFGSYTPKTVAHIKSLVEAGFYNGKNFHRIIPGFMAQGGAPVEGETPENIEDEFNRNLIFDSKYLLAMANANDGATTDTGSTQFFITSAQTRWLDFRHTIFGMLVSGEAAFAKIMAAGTAEGTTTKNVVITSARMIADTKDTVIAMTAKKGTSGKVTVTATDSKRSTASRSFTLKGTTDTTTDPPFLNPLPATYTTYKNVPIHFTTSFTDIQGANYPIFLMSEISADLTMTRDGNGNAFIVTPDSDITGSYNILMGVPQAWHTDESNQTVLDKVDTQWVTITILDQDFVTVDENGVATLHGTNGDDLLAVSLIDGGANIEFSLNQQKRTLPVASVQRLVVDGGDGNDNIQIAAAMTKPASLLGGLGVDTIQGGNGADTIWGGGGNDSINGMGGNDLIYGDNGSDHIWGGSGNDTIYGGADSDWITAEAGNDLVYGGAGNDTITGGTGSDQLYGEAGNDLFYAKDKVRDTIKGSDGTDKAQWDTIDRRLDTLSLLA